MTIGMFHRIKSYLRIITISMILSIGFVWLVCFFNECSFSQAFKVQETKVFAWIAIWGNLFLILTCALGRFMDFTTYRERQQESDKRF